MSALLEEEQWPFILMAKLFLFSEDITLGADEKIDELAGGASGMGVDRIGEVVTWLVKDRLLG